MFDIIILIIAFLTYSPLIWIISKLITNSKYINNLKKKLNLYEIDNSNIFRLLITKILNCNYCFTFHFTWIFLISQSITFTIPICVLIIILSFLNSFISTQIENALEDIKNEL